MTKDPFNIFDDANMRPEKGEDLEKAMVSKQTLVDDSKKLTIADVQEALPGQVKMRVDQEFVDKLNNVCLDPDIRDQVAQNFVDHTVILKDGKYKLEQYLEACTFVTYKMLGFTNQDAYANTFPDRIRRLRAEGKDDKHISAFVAAYRKNKLVNQIMEQALIPVHVLNAGLFQKALNHQAYLMEYAKSEKVQSDAAKSLLDTLKPPEKSKLEVDMTVTDNSGIEELKGILTSLAQRQVTLIESGESTKAVAHTEIFSKEPSE